MVYIGKFVNVKNNNKYEQFKNHLTESVNILDSKVVTIEHTTNSIQTFHSKSKKERKKRKTLTKMNKHTTTNH